MSRWESRIYCCISSVPQMVSEMLLHYKQRDENVENDENRDG